MKKIIMEGKLPTGTIFRVICPHCLTKFECDNNDFKKSCERSYYKDSVTCPFCDTIISVYGLNRLEKICKNCNEIIFKKNGLDKDSIEEFFNEEYKCPQCEAHVQLHFIKPKDGKIKMDKLYEEILDSFK